MKFRIAAVLLFSLGLKLCCRHLAPMVSRDGCFYIYLAQVWHDSGDFAGLLRTWPEMWLPPLFFYLMKLLMHCGLSAETAGVTVNIAAGSLIPLWCYGIALNVTRRRDVALAALILAAVHPTLNQLSIQVQRDALYLSLTGASLYLLTAGIRRGRRREWLGSGILAGLALLTRFEAAELPVLVSAALFFQVLSGVFPRRRALLFLALWLAGFIGSQVLFSGVMRTQGYLAANYCRYYRRSVELFVQRIQQL